MVYWYSVGLFVLHFFLVMMNVAQGQYKDACMGFLSILIYSPLLGRTLGWW